MLGATFDRLGPTASLRTMSPVSTREPGGYRLLSSGGEGSEQAGEDYRHRRPHHAQRVAYLAANDQPSSLFARDGTGSTPSTIPANPYGRV